MKNAKLDPELVEKLADYAHEAWSGWMKYLFKVSDDFGDESVVITPSHVKRWRRQMSTPYADLPDHEKESDRVEARKMLEVMHNHKDGR